jgi:hypothetical protein
VNSRVFQLLKNLSAGYEGSTHKTPAYCNSKEANS